MNSPDPFGSAANAFVDIARAWAQPVVWYERQIMRVLRWRLNSAAPEPSDVSTKTLADESLHAAMGALLDRALEQTSNAGSTDLYRALLDQLVPDEARIIAALSDGSAGTLLHVYQRTANLAGGKALIENASLVGRTANITLPHRTPVYVGHLLSLGLVEIGPEDPQLKDEYEILGAENEVRAAIKEASRGPIPPRVAHHTVRLSQLGLDFWAACNTAAHDPGSR